MQQMPENAPAPSFVDWLNRYLNMVGSAGKSFLRSIDAFPEESAQRLISLMLQNEALRQQPDLRAMLQNRQNQLQATPPPADVPQQPFSEYLLQNSPRLGAFLKSGLQETVQRQKTLFEHVLETLRQRFGIPSDPAGTGASQVM